MIAENSRSRPTSSAANVSARASGGWSFGRPRAISRSRREAGSGERSCWSSHFANASASIRASKSSPWASRASSRRPPSRLRLGRTPAHLVREVQGIEGSSRGEIAVHQGFGGAEIQTLEPFPLDVHPVLEVGGTGIGVFGEEGAGVGRDSGDQIPRFQGGEEDVRIHRHRDGEMDLAGGQLGPGIAQTRPDPVEGGAQCLARPLGRTVTPEQGGELGSGGGFSGAGQDPGQDGEELGFARGPARRRLPPERPGRA